MKIKDALLPLILISGYLNAAAIDEKVTMCNDCHGNNGVSEHSDIPTIAGYSESSISDMLIAFAEEERPEIKSKFRHGDTTRPETTMIEIAKELSEDDIEKLATYYSSQPFVAAKQDFDPKLAKKGAKLHKNRCIKCHEEGGSSPDDDAGLLAGQWSPYLKSALEHFKRDERMSDEEMVKKIKKLSEQQIESLIHYYASQQ
jgi:sulfide dehydrogenase cytochrome subunit